MTAFSTVVLVSMPFVELSRPCLGLSLLKSLLLEDGLSVRVEYGSLTLAERIGFRDYSWITESNRFWSHVMLGEYLYASSAFPNRKRDDKRVLDLLFAYSALKGEKLTAVRAKTLLRLRRLEKEATAHIDSTAKSILAQKPKIVGCTSTFQQHVSSLALLKRIRELQPDVVTMMGGANCETEMGVATHRNFPWVDFVVSGDGDGLVTQLCRAVLNGDPLPHGVLTPTHRQKGYPLPTPRAVFRDLDRLPPPEYDDYFQQLSESALASRIRVGVPAETSRGCWWGAVSHCTFCGLNGGSMGFNSKDPDRVLKEFDGLSERWGVTSFEVVDNILDMDYFKNLVPALAERDFNLFYETKSNLKKAQVKALADAGIRWIQPGIESLDTRVLDLMKKGARGATQVNLLKWARVYGIHLSYNLLWDFPGEEDDWYAESAKIFPKLHHLQPPSGMTNIRFDRYSPYFRQQDELDFELKPHPLMAEVYPLPSDQIAQLAYHFYRVPLVSAGPGVQSLRDAVTEWRQAFPKSNLVLQGNIVRDSRKCAVAAEQTLSDSELELLHFCEEGKGERQLSTQQADIARELVEKNLILFLDGRYTSLTTPAETPSYPYRPPFPGGEVYEDTFEALYRPLVT